MAEEKKKMGRPRIDIDKDDFENLLEIGADEEDVRAWFARKLNKPDLSIDTIYRFCKREYGVTFAEFSKQRKKIGKMRVLQAYFRRAPDSDSLIIFGLKNLCGWKDNPDEIKAPAEPIRIVIEKAEGNNARTQAE